MKFFCEMVGTNLGKCEWVWEEILRWLIPRWPYSRWQNSRWLPSSSSVRMNEFESDWISWVRVRVEWECFWVNLKEDNKVSGSKMAGSESNMTEFKMAAIIKLSQSELVKFFVQMLETNLGKCESIWDEILRLLIPIWPYSRWQNSRWLPSSS